MGIDIFIHDDEDFPQPRRQAGGGTERLPRMARLPRFHLNHKESPPAAFLVDCNLLDAADADFSFSP